MTDEEKRRAQLIKWLTACPFAEYSTDALEAAYLALTEDEE